MDQWRSATVRAALKLDAAIDYLPEDKQDAIRRELKAVTLAVAGLPENVREQYLGLSDDHFLRILEKGISLKDYAEVLSTPEWKAAADKIVGC